MAVQIKIVEFISVKMTSGLHRFGSFEGGNFLVGGCPWTHLDFRTFLSNQLPCLFSYLILNTERVDVVILTCFSGSGIRICVLPAAPLD